jgi:thiosulfate/3-mercaptopyruvate sulfurtransferase
VVAGETGRHPLPDLEQLCQRLDAWGIDAGVQVVVYDNAGGLYAGRLWWLLRYLGHAPVALLDGDWRAWQREERPTRSGDEQRTPRTFEPDVLSSIPMASITEAEEIIDEIESGGLLLLDARGADRYRGENEITDPIAGHIPGAHSAPFVENLDANGHWLDADALRSRYTALLGNRPAGEVVAYCGSGVSACHTLLAMEIAGLPGASLYPGSWSHWITDPSRPVATGAEPGSAEPDSA